MKTFNKEDLITWANREKAVLGNKYYFAHTLIGLQNVLKSSSYIETLKEIDENDISSPFSYYDHEEGYICNFACILPVEAVKDKVIEPKKKYRPCKTIKELHGLVNDRKCDIGEEVCIDELIGDCIVHYRSKKTGREFYSVITCVIKHEEGYLVYLGGSIFFIRII